MTHKVISLDVLWSHFSLFDWTSVGSAGATFCQREAFGHPLNQNSQFQQLLRNPCSFPCPFRDLGQVPTFSFPKQQAPILPTPENPVQGPHRWEFELLVYWSWHTFLLNPLHRKPYLFRL